MNNNNKSTQQSQSPNLRTYHSRMAWHNVTICFYSATGNSCNTGVGFQEIFCRAHDNDNNNSIIVVVVVLEPRMEIWLVGMNKGNLETEWNSITISIMILQDRENQLVLLLGR
jgi:hypothetical protein